MLVALSIAKWAGWETLAKLDWWWLLVPLFALIAWFEIFERMFGFDSKRKLEDASFERAKSERIKGQLKKAPTRKR
jgi:small Trp-rich protein